MLGENPTEAVGRRANGAPAIRLPTIDFHGSGFGQRVGEIVRIARAAADRGAGTDDHRVLRLAVPRPGFTPCTWLTTVSRDDLIERAAVLSAAKLSEIDDALRLGGLG